MSRKPRAKKGSGGLRSSSAFNWARALPLIVILAVVGGFYVYRSQAGTAEDVANVILFFASDESRAITGQVIYVDGGYQIMGM